jgi:hypothetical protein
MSTRNNKENELIKRRVTSPFSRANVNNDSQESNSLPSKSSLTTVPTGTDWESDKRRSKPTDDGTVSFFWRAHTITWLIIAMSYLFYVAILEQPSDDSTFNTKR